MQRPFAILMNGVLDIYAIIRKMDLPKTRCIPATLDK